MTNQPELHSLLQSIRQLARAVDVQSRKLDRDRAAGYFAEISETAQHDQLQQRQHKHGE